MALDPNTKPKTPGTINGEIRNGWSWVSIINQWADFSTFTNTMSGVNYDPLNTLNLQSSPTTTQTTTIPGLNIAGDFSGFTGQPLVGLPDYSINLDKIKDLPDNAFNINVNAGFGNGPEFRDLNTAALNNLLNNVQPNVVKAALVDKLVTITINKTPDRGDVYLNGNRETRTVIPFQISAIPLDGHIFKLVYSSKTHPDIYKIKRVDNTGIAAGAGTSVLLYKNDSVVGTVNGTIFTSQINWDTSIWDISNTIQPTPKVSIDVLFDSSNISSLLNYSFDGNSGNLTEGVFEANDTGVFSITPISSDYNFQYILKKNGVVLSSSSSPKQSYNLQPGISYTLNVSASKGIIPDSKPPIVGVPSISVSSTSITYNLSGGGPGISYSTSNADSVRYSLGNTTRTLSANGSISFSKSDFSGVGNFELYLQPISSLGGSGDVKKVIINVSDKQSFADRI